MNPATALSKGAATRELILSRALEIADARGIDAITIGTLADAVGMSKSGVFAHFGSREELQLAVLDAAARGFTEEVFVPAVRERRGMPRLRAILHGWMRRTLRYGESHACPIGAAALEFDDRPGPIRERVLEHLIHLRREIARAVAIAVQQGHLRADTDPDQIAFEVHGLVLAFQFELKLFGMQRALPRVESAVERLLAALAVPGQDTNPG